MQGLAFPTRARGCGRSEKQMGVCVCLEFFAPFVVYLISYRFHEGWTLLPGVPGSDLGWCSSLHWEENWSGVHFIKTILLLRKNEGLTMFLLQFVYFNRKCLFQRILTILQKHRILCLLDLYPAFFPRVQNEIFKLCKCNKSLRKIRLRGIVSKTPNRFPSLRVDFPQS